MTQAQILCPLKTQWCLFFPSPSQYNIARSLRAQGSNRMWPLGSYMTMVKGLRSWASVSFFGRIQTPCTSEGGGESWLGWRVQSAEQHCTCHTGRVPWKVSTAVIITCWPAAAAATIKPLVETLELRSYTLSRNEPAMIPFDSRLKGQMAKLISVTNRSWIKGEHIAKSPSKERISGSGAGSKVWVLCNFIRKEGPRQNCSP